MKSLLQHLSERTEKHVGYRIVSRNSDGSLVTQRGWEVNGTLGNVEVHTPTASKSIGLYMGTTKKFVLDYYTDDVVNPVLLSYEYQVEDILKGAWFEDHSEIVVKRAKLIAIEDL